MIFFLSNLLQEIVYIFFENWNWLKILEQFYNFILLMEKAQQQQQQNRFLFLFSWIERYWTKKIWIDKILYTKPNTKNFLPFDNKRCECSHHNFLFVQQQQLKSKNGVKCKHSFNVRIRSSHIKLNVKWFWFFSNFILFSFSFCVLCRISNIRFTVILFRFVCENILLKCARNPLNQIFIIYLILLWLFDFLYLF